MSLDLGCMVTFPSPLSFLENIVHMHDYAEAKTEILSGFDSFFLEILRFKKCIRR